MSWHFKYPAHYLTFLFLLRPTDHDVNEPQRSISLPRLSGYLSAVFLHAGRKRRELVGFDDTRDTRHVHCCSRCAQPDRGRTVSLHYATLVFFIDTVDVDQAADISLACVVVVVVIVKPVLRIGRADGRRGAQRNRCTPQPAFEQ